MDITIDQFVRGLTEQNHPSISNLSTIGKVLLIPALIGAGVPILLNSFCTVFLSLPELPTYRRRAYRGFDIRIIDETYYSAKNESLTIFFISDDYHKTGRYSVTSSAGCYTYDDRDSLLSDFLPIDRHPKGAHFG